MNIKKPFFLFICSSNIILFVLTPGKNELHAQSKTQAFDSFKIGLKFITNTNRNTFHNYWNPEKGFECFAEMPFYYGSVQAGVHVFLYNDKDNDIPEFLTRYFYLGWGKELPLPLKINWFNGFRVGSYQMIFDDDEINETQIMESELGAGLSSRLSYPVYKKLMVGISVSYIAVFTYKKVELTFISVGADYTFTTPKWIKDILE
jgi:hypothetical protein